MWRLKICLGLGVVAAAACEFPKPQDVVGDGSIDATVTPDGPDSGASSKACSVTTCADGVLEQCGASQTVEHTEQCALGCASDQPRCTALVPSNGLEPSLAQASLHAEIMLPAGSVIDTDTGAVTSAGTPIPVAGATVVQLGGPMVRVLLARSWTIYDVRIRGALPVAFVASDDITVRGVIDASADAAANGPGALECGSASGGGGPAQGFTQRVSPGASPGYPPYLWSSSGFGGGGFGTAGGAGGIVLEGLQVGSAGQVNGSDELIPLRGGCEGAGATSQVRGSGGGAVQLVAARTVHFVATVAGKGEVHVGGGGGVAGALGRSSDTDQTPVWGPGGGGSGGGILIEAPNVVLDDHTALLAAGGAGGGYGACNPPAGGADAAPDATTPAGGRCPPATHPIGVGGDGATAGSGASGADNMAGGSAGSGGGGLGRIRINTKDGGYSAGASAVIRGAVTKGAVGRR